MGTLLRIVVGQKRTIGGQNEREQDRRIEQLTQEIESLKQQRIVNP